jgi:hypothetical protein
MIGWRRTLAVTVCLVVLVLVVLGLGAAAASLPECTTDSQESPPFIITSAPCGTYGIVTTRREAVNGVETDITVQFTVHSPSGPRRPKGLVVLFSGGIGATGITGDPATGQVFTSNNNFLVRSAQLFAERGYRAVTIDRPSVAPMDQGYDLYRVSAKHAQDIATVIARANRANSDVFLAGTSSGTLSVVPQWMLGIGSMLSSPVTVGPPTAAYIGSPSFPTLQPAFVGVPVHVMAHAVDACGATSPANALSLHQQFLTAGVWSEFDQLTGGFDQSSDPTVGPCGARAYHGFLGIENAAVGEITARMDDILRSLETRFPKNRRPTARFVHLVTNVQFPALIDLRFLTDDLDHDRLTFFLPYATSSRGATIELRGPVAIYWPNQPGIRDGFVYVVSDRRGGMNAGVVTVDVISGFPR